MKKFIINGDIVSRDCDKTSKEDITTVDFENFLSTLDKGEIYQIEINSCGGDVYAGIAIANKIRQASKNGNSSLAHIVSIAASIASIIACACDDLIMDDNAFVMMHLPWCVAQGNENELKKQIENLEMCKKAMISIYRTKFALPDDEIEKMMEIETWIDSGSISDYNFRCVVTETDAPLRIAAKIQRFNNVPFTIKGLIMDNDDIEIKTEDEVDENKTSEATVIEEKTEEKVEEKVEEKTEDDYANLTVEELIEIIKNLKSELEKKSTDEQKPEMIPVDECDKRVSGIQAKFDSQICEYKAKIQENENIITDLQTKLDKMNSELVLKQAALIEKQNALENLNSSVNCPKASVDWRKLKGKDFWDFCEKHKNQLNNLN